jgi:hypothetical protein
MNFVINYCITCCKEYEATRACHKYCSHACQERKRRKNKGLIRDIGRYCKQCGIHFLPDTANKLHCSDECAIKSARQSRAKFLKQNPDSYKKYYNTSKIKNGKDGNLIRLYKRYPDLPKQCQSCGEDRILDIAHKPKYKRMGAWRSVKNTTPEKIWILCPTCHALIDRKGYDPQQLGLKE